MNHNLYELPEWTFEFLLRFKLLRPHADPNAYLRTIPGCNNSTIFVRQDGSITVHFSRTADSATTAIACAIADVTCVIPCMLLSAELVTQMKKGVLKSS